MSINELYCKLLMTVLIVCIFSCQKTVNISYNDLEGKWNIVETKRNSVITRTMERAWIDFKSKQMTNNFLDNEIYSNYMLEKNKIVHFNNAKQTYRIVRWQHDSLWLTSRIQNYKFEFILTKEMSAQRDLEEIMK